MKVQIIKTGEVMDLRYRAAQRLVLKGKARWYEESIEDNFTRLTRLKELTKLTESIEPVKKKSERSKPKNESNFKYRQKRFSR